ncbi:SAF domain-containing protein [Propionibacteriaceae bacterium Y2011]|uniref:SAF domain-containing protein n=1 Tax=Microlunatus sp. Y2014 TaxID=3418488 RepID=UPI003B4D9C29
MKSSNRGPQPFLGALRRAVSWHRRKLAVLAAVVTVVATITVVNPAPPPSTEVVVTTTALPGGRTLTADDLRLVAMPVGLVPEQVVTDPATVVGRVLTAPLPAGQVITELSVVSPRMTGPEDGLVVAPLRLADADVVAMLAVGDFVDVLAADPQVGSSEVVAERARVAAITAGAEAGPLGTGGTDAGRLVLVEVTPQVARGLAAASVNARLTIVWRA